MKCVLLIVRMAAAGLISNIRVLWILGGYTKNWGKSVGFYAKDSSKSEKNNF